MIKTKALVVILCAHAAYEYAHIVQFLLSNNNYCSQACASNYKRVQLLIFPPVFVLFLFTIFFVDYAKLMT